MASTFRNLTNQLLRRLNEVEVDEVSFVDCRGVQALAKDAIKNSIAKINAAEYEWPFNSAEHTQQLSIGQEEYSWPQYFKVVDWNSFQLQQSASLGVSHKMLSVISRDTYYSQGKDRDDNAPAGLSAPISVAQGHGNGYIVTPSPNQAYAIQYRYFLNHTALSAGTDATRIPDSFDHILIEGALYQMHMFRNNNEAASISLQLFQQGIKEMQGILINQYETVTDTRTLRVVRAYF